MSADELAEQYRGRGIGVERWLEEFEELPMKPEVRQKILLDNAKKLLGLD